MYNTHDIIHIYYIYMQKSDLQFSLRSMFLMMSPPITPCKIGYIYIYNMDISYIVYVYVLYIIIYIPNGH